MAQARARKRKPARAKLRAPRQVNVACAMRCYEAHHGAGAKALRRTVARQLARGGGAGLRLYAFLAGSDLLCDIFLSMRVCPFSDSELFEKERGHTYWMDEFVLLDIL